jgi:hypothetical protein
MDENYDIQNSAESNEAIVPKNNELEIFSNISDTLPNNKEILLISLLEYICHNNKSYNLFNSICQYLYSIGIIDDEESFSNKYSDIRFFYVNYFKKLLLKNNKDKNPKKLLEDGKLFMQYGNDLIGSRYSTDFIELDKIGNGSFGIVYAAKNKLDNTNYAIKKIPLNFNTEENYKILKEVRFLAKLNNNNIVRYFTSWIEFSDDISLLDELNQNSNSQNLTETEKITYFPIIFIQMELCKYTLKLFIEKRNKFIEEINIKQVRDIILQISKGLKYIQDKKIIHRDLSPKNILIDDNLIVKISDFGMAKNLISENIEETNSEYGTILYSPPEFSENICSEKSDIYSLGIIYFEILNMFKTDMEKIKIINNLKQDLVDEKLNQKYPDDINLIKKMINKNLDERPNIDNIISFLLNYN